MPGAAAGMSFNGFVKETYGRGAECMEDGRDGRIGAMKYAGGNGTRKRGGKAEHITQG